MKCRNKKKRFLFEKSLYRDILSNVKYVPKIIVCIIIMYGNLNVKKNPNLYIFYSQKKDKHA